MYSSVRLVRIFAVAYAATLLGCGGEGPPLSPSSLTPLAAPPSSLSIRPSDYHEPVPMPDPAPAPMPDPSPAPMPDPAPAPMPDPTALTISIVGSFGRSAFTPNPIQASVGSMIVWTNGDTTLHDIVLDDGTAIGSIAPGRSSVPMALATATATYYCTIHPSMVGSINGAAAPAPPPDDVSPPDSAPPPDYGGGYRH